MLNNLCDVPSQRLLQVHLVFIGHLTQGDFEQGKDEGITYPKRLKLSTEHDEHMSLKMKCQNIQFSWKQCSPLPETIAAGTAVVIGNKVYVSHTFFRSKIFEYEILANVWSNEIECPRQYFSLAVLNEQLTLVGGGATPSNAGSNIVLSLTDNPTMVGTKQWSENCKPMQKTRIRPAVASNSSYFVVAGGDRGYTPATVEVMELGTQEWHAPSTLPNHDCFVSSATIIEDKLYLTFGYSNIESLCPVVTCSLTALVKSSESATTQGIVRPLLWQKLPVGPPLYRPRTVQLCGNLLAVGGYATLGYNSRKDKEMYECKGSVYVYDEEKRKWTLVCQLPSNKGFPDNNFAVVSLREDGLIVMGGTQYSDENESLPPSDIVHVGSLALTSNFS